MNQIFENKNGFTLIELLSVIVVFSIIALISIPLIINVIEDARLNSFRNIGYGIIKSGEIKLADEMFKLNGKNSLNIVFQLMIQNKVIREQSQIVVFYR